MKHEPSQASATGRPLGAVPPFVAEPAESSAVAAVQLLFYNRFYTMGASYESTLLSE